MIGLKFYKTDYYGNEYAKCATWCNTNNATIEDKGDYYEVVAIPAPALSELKQAKLSEVNHWTEQKIIGGFVSNASGQPVKYDSDVDTQITMQGICINVNTPLFAEKYPDGCPVRGYAEGKTTKDIFMLNAEQVLKWQADLSMHIGQCKQAGWELQAKVNACTTKEELDKIVFGDVNA